MEERRSVRRPVRSADPNLSDEANALLTEELRDAIGADTVDLPEGTPDPAGAGSHTHRSFIGALIENRIAIGMTFLVFVVVGGIIALITHSVWILVAAILVHWAATTIFTTTILRATGELEHVSPSHAARLEAEGLSDPDARLTELVEEYTPPSGDNEDRTVAASDDPGTATSEQRDAVTPSSEGTTPVGPGSDDDQA